jgi:hypothetical protein
MTKATQVVVPHPRFGDKPRPSGCSATVAEARKDWGTGYFSEHVFVESAIPADPSKQNYSISPRKYYVDTKKTCRDCGKYFIFFAEEQRYWYEELGFYVDADCVRCTECRHAVRRLRFRLSRYSCNITDNQLDDESLAVLVDDATFLWEQGILKDKEKLYRLRKIALARIPNHLVTKRMVAILDPKRGRDEVQE